MTHFLIFLILILSVSCAKNSKEKVSDAIDVALTHLSSDRCDEAISVLEEAGMQSSNPVYLQVLASAYACKAGFNLVTFISDDITAIDPTSGEKIFKSLSILTLSPESSADSANYAAIKTGLNLVLNSRNQVERQEAYGLRKAGDMGVQALILNIVNFGKFLHFYGNVDASGTKGANSCFINYNDPRAQLLVGVSTGACVSSSAGHADLDQTTVVGKRRMCEGLMSLTNILDILNNIDFSNSPSLEKLDDVASQVNLFKTAAEGFGLGTLINMTSQSECETYLNTPSQLLDMEYLYAIVFESGLQ